MHYPCFHYYIVITHYYHYYPLLHVTNGATCRWVAGRVWAWWLAGWGLVGGQGGARWGSVGVQGGAGWVKRRWLVGCMGSLQKMFIQPERVYVMAE